jgi:C4-dicarboxylate transporter DctM subunit
MVLYAYVTESSVGALFLAGVAPGLMMAAMFAAWVFLTEGHAKAPPGDPPPARAAVALRRAGWSLSLPVFVLGGIYFDVFTATEAAGTARSGRSSSRRWSTGRSACATCSTACRRRRTPRRCC